MSVQDVAARAATKGKDALLARWQAFREESPYFQAKVGLVAAWAVVAILTVFIAPPSPIPFVIEQKSMSFGLSAKTTLTIFNQNAGNLEDATVEITGATIDFDDKELPGSWRTKKMVIPEGLKTTLSTESFFDKSGISPGHNLRIVNVRVLDDDDDELYNGPAATPPK